jgi:hypothetical protein
MESILGEEEKKSFSWLSGLFKPVSMYQLVAFRFAFGVAMSFWTIFMILSGSVHTLFIEPEFYFSYPGFEWLQPLPPVGMYLCFIALLASSLMIAAGWYYRISSLTFTLLFAYITLIDRANYISYYYFVLLLAFMLSISPANRLFSIDQLRKPTLRVDYVPKWSILAIQIQVALVFVFAGMAKLNFDWLFNGKPVNIWLSELATNQGLILPGFLLDGAFPIALSWFLILFDFIIPHFLLDKKTSWGAFLFVLVIQIFALLIFPAGFFPLLTVASCIIFIPEERIHSIISRVSYFLYDIFGFHGDVFTPGGAIMLQYRKKRLFPALLMIFFGLQVFLPVTLFLNWGSDRWADSAFRFSWDIRMHEKTGKVAFWLSNPITGEEKKVNLDEYLSKHQQSRMSEDPAMIRQFGNFMMLQYKDSSNTSPTLHAEAVISLNGGIPQPLLNDSWEFKKANK